MTKVPEKISQHEAQAMTLDQPASQSDFMELDPQTIKDLEIFESETSTETLFNFCNHTRNESGAEALKKRMSRPWSNPERISAVQQSLSFMLEHRQVFDTLPSYATTEIVERYFNGFLPLVMSVNSVEFGFGVLELRFGDTNRYSMILRGVDVTSSLIYKLRSIVFAPELSSPSGEVALIFEEMRTLLSHSKFSQVADQEAWSLSAWKVLRTDQIFRLYEKQAVARLLQLTYELDALLAMADTIRKNDFIMPDIKTGALSVQAEAVKHPLIAKVVANPIKLDQKRRLLFLTGPNMAGKTTYLRACAIALYFAHLGMGVPARSFSFVPAQRLFSSITLADDIHSGVSYFHAEALRMKSIAKAVSEGYRVIAFMDEPFKGTNIKDAYDASLAIMERLADKEDNLFMFSSHLIELCDQMETIENIDCRYFEAIELEDRLNFEYTLRPGISTQRLGMRVLEEEGIFELLDNNN